MREHLLSILKDLKVLTGHKQYEEIAAIPDKAKAQEELDRLLRPMVNVCHSFGFIPNEQKERIIRKKIIEDREFYGLNAQKIYHYLQSVSEKYYVESHHLEAQKVLDHQPGPLSAATQAQIDRYMAQLATSTFKPSYHHLGTEMEKIKAEDAERQQGRKGTSQTVAARARQYAELHQKKENAMRARGIDKLGLHELKKFEVEGQIIWCRSQEEALEIYTEVYLS